MISREMTVGYTVHTYPQTVPVFMKYGMPCLTCPGTSMESIEMAARIHGLEPEVLERELNDALGDAVGN
ncbi:MAG: DUF1858 domain-containing protein [Chloroflexi bacterium]|nr:DUF1858 domain-containing protein [Chloroflexota bacterium]